LNVNLISNVKGGHLTSEPANLYVAILSILRCLSIT